MRCIKCNVKTEAELGKYNYVMCGPCNVMRKETWNKNKKWWQRKRK